MSKIQEELMKATGLEKKRNESRQDLLLRLMLATKDLKDPEWDDLSQKAQDWFNDAADAKNAKASELPEFPDLEKAEPEAKTSRRGSSKKETSDRLAKVGDTVTIETLRGKVVTGKVVELDADVTVLEVDGKEEEFAVDRIKSCEIQNDSQGEEENDEAEEDVVKVGKTVTVVTKRGKEVTGKIVELDDEVLVLDVDGKDEEFDRGRVESIKPAGGAKEETSTRRRGSSDKAEDKGEPEGKAKRVSNEGVSIGTRIKELIADNLDADEAAIGKILKKEGLEFKDNTLKLNFVDAHKFVTILKTKKLLK